MSLRRVDLRFALPHPVRRAAVLDAEAWREALAEAGVEVADAGELDLACAPAQRAAEAAALGARAVLLEGRGGRRALRRAGYHTSRFLPLPTIEAPDLVLPLARDAPVGYALRTWRPARSRAKRARNAALAGLARLGALPDLRPLQTLGLREPGPPLAIASAAALGADPEAQWFLTLGQGDALTRAVFHLFPPGSAEPAWALKLARVPGYEKPFARDERGLALAHDTGGNAAAHAPRLLGRFEVDGHHASLETAALGERLSTLLPRRTDGARTAFADVAGWTQAVGAETAAKGIDDELERLEREVVPRWNAPAGLLDAVRSVPSVLQHNDLGTWNVVFAGPGRFTVLDWESARPAGLPLWDLLYFAVDALGQLDRMGSFEERTAHAVRLLRGDLPASSTLFEWIRRYVQELQLPPESVGTARDALLARSWPFARRPRRSGRPSRAVRTAAACGANRTDLARGCAARPGLGPLALGHPRVQRRDGLSGRHRRVGPLEAGTGCRSTLPPLVLVPQQSGRGLGKTLWLRFHDDAVVRLNPLCAGRRRDDRHAGGDGLQHLDLHPAAAFEREEKERQAAQERSGRWHAAERLNSRHVVDKRTRPASGDLQPRVRGEVPHARPQVGGESPDGARSRRPGRAADQTRNGRPVEGRGRVATWLEAKRRKHDLRSVSGAPPKLVGDHG